MLLYVICSVIRNQFMLFQLSISCNCCDTSGRRSWMTNDSYARTSTVPAKFWANCQTLRLLTPARVTHHIELCDLLCSLILENLQEIDQVHDFILTLNRQISAIIYDAPPEIAHNFLCCSWMLNSVSLPRLKPETASKKLLNTRQWGTAFRCHYINGPYHSEFYGTRL